MTTHDTVYLNDIKGYSPYILAEMAEVNSPPNRESYGARMLVELRDEVVEAWEAGRFEFDRTRGDYDVCTDLAGSTLTDMSHPVFAAWVDICAWSEGWPEGHEPEEPGVYVFTGTIEDMVRDCLDTILIRFAMAVVADIRKALDAWVCPGCGDTDDPRICYPDDCRSSDEDRAAYAAQLAADAAQAEPVVQDPILDLIAQREAEGPQGASDTQAFMAYMGQVNREEFGVPMGLARKVAISTLAVLALIGLVAVGMVMFG